MVIYRQVDNDNQVNLIRWSMNIELIYGKEDKIIVEVESGAIKFKFRKENLNPFRNKMIKITLFFEDIEGVSLNGIGGI